LHAGDATFRSFLKPGAVRGLQLTVFRGLMLPARVFREPTVRKTAKDGGGEKKAGIF
jgi:hypothetical protein